MHRIPGLMDRAFLFDCPKSIGQLFSSRPETSPAEAGPVLWQKDHAVIELSQVLRCPITVDLKM
jgi:hypothetical protein